MPRRRPGALLACSLVFIEAATTAALRQTVYDDAFGFGWSGGAYAASSGVFDFSSASRASGAKRAPASLHRTDATPPRSP